MSYTVFLNGNTSYLKTVLFPSLHLDPLKQWEAALLDFATYNSIPNVIENVNNKFHYVNDDEITEVVELKTGSYEIDDIADFLGNAIGKGSIILKPNNNLLCCELKCRYPVDFSKENSIGELLGYSKRLLSPDRYHLSDKHVNIIRVNIINVACNIVRGAYDNGTDGHIIHSFYPTVPPGFKIVEKPHNLVYLPVRVSNISDIVLVITDQNGELINFRGETISARLHIRSI